jgi:hypothetical protein
MAPNWYVPIAIMGIVLAVVLALNVAASVFSGMVSPSDMVAWLVVGGLIACFQAIVIKWQAPLAVLMFHAMRAVYVIMSCGVLFGWYLDKFTPYADAKMATELILLLSFACLAGGAFALGSMHRWPRQAIFALLGVLFMVMLLVTSVTSVYTNAAEAARAVPAMVVGCHLAYWFAVVAGKPSNFERVFEISTVFVVDLTLMTALLLSI